MTGLNPAFREAVLAKRAGLPPPAPKTVVAPVRKMPHYDEHPSRILAEARKLFALATAERAEAARILADARIEAELIRSAAQAEAPAPHAPAIDAILRDVCERHGVTLSALRGVGRQRELTAARHEAIRLAHAARPELSMAALGRIFRRNHTTILHALRKDAGGGA